MRNMPLDYIDPPVSKKPRKHPKITPEFHQEIKRLYQNKSGHSGEVREFARRYGLPRWKITRYAQEQGWSQRQKKEPDWSESELRILNRNAMHCPGVIQKKLKWHGFSRSIVGIVLKRKRMRMLSNLDGYSARSVAICIGEDEHFVTKAIKDGRLKAIRRMDERTQQQGGSCYYIKEKDVRSFIIENINMIDVRKVDKYWFVDVLTGKEILDN